MREKLVVTSLEGYLEIAFKNFENKKKGFLYEDIFYRGHSDKDYELVPSIARNRKFSTDITIFSFERNLIESAKTKFPHIFSNDLLPVDLLAMLQHHGIPTRLLDVTSNPLVALYFACQDTKKDGEVVFISTKGREIAEYPINNAVAESYKFAISTRTSLEDFYRNVIEQPYFLEQKSKLLFCNETPNAGANWIESCCKEISIVSGKEYTLRQKAQKGMYIIFPNKIISEIGNKDGNYYFDDIIESIPKDHSNIKEIVIIDKNFKNDILEKLELIGISESTLFPDNIDIVFKDMIKTFKRRI